MNLLHKMEMSNNGKINNSVLPIDRNFSQISCNWQITNKKQFYDVFTVIPSSQDSQKTDIEDVVSLDTCISLQPTESNTEACMLDIKFTNGQRISKIAVVSESYVLEFFKQYGEYETTVFAEFVDEFEDSSVYFAETVILPHTTEASIKFGRTKKKNATMWIYGIRLYLTEPCNEPKSFSTEIFNPEIIQSFLTKLNLNTEGSSARDDVQTYYRNVVNVSKYTSIQEQNEKGVAQSSKDNNVPSSVNIVSYIDKKFQDMEERLTKRMNEIEQKTNEKLDNIFKKLETYPSSK